MSEKKLEGKVYGETEGGRPLRRLGNLYGFEVIGRGDRKRRRDFCSEKNEYTELNPKMREICTLSSRGFTSAEISKILAVSTSVVENVTSSELGRARISEMLWSSDKETRIENERIKHLTHRALDIYQQAFDDEDSGELSLRDRIDAAQFFLKEMSGLRAPTKTQTQSISTTLTPEELAAFRERGLAAAQEGGLIENNGDDDEKGE